MIRVKLLGYLWRTRADCKDEWLELERLRNRIKRALEKIRPGLGDEVGRMAPGAARTKINEITGNYVPNGPVVPTMRALAEALENHVDARSSDR